MYNKIFKLQENFFKALAHSRRLEIVNLLRDTDLSVTQIYTMLDLPQANISQHLHILREANIVCYRKTGKKIVYYLKNKKIIDAVDLLREILIDELSDIGLVTNLTKEITSFLPLTHDTVCKMRISPKTASFIHDHNGKRYYFCASKCLENFKKEPTKYAK